MSTAPHHQRQRSTLYGAVLLVVAVLACWMASAIDEPLFTLGIYAAAVNVALLGLVTALRDRSA